MKIHPSADDAARRDDPVAAATATAQDEAKLRLGFGHRAHSPDPAAQYGFTPGEPRVLPVEKKKRWRVPG
jgi:hypothetical protein